MAYSDKQKTDIISTVCERISGGEALRTVLKDKELPSYSTFYIWLEADENKSKQYTHACEERQDSMFEDMLDIADDQEGDVYKDKEGEEKTNHNVIQRSRLRIDTRKWALSKLNPKKYGDKIDYTSGGDKINAPLNVVLPDGQTMETVAKEIQEILNNGSN